MRYDPCVDPDAVQWLRLSEDARIEAVLEWHAREPPSGNPRLHAVAHVVVENILAEGELAVATTKLQELLADGLDRHAAVHAMCTAVLSVIMEVQSAPEGTMTPREVEALQASRLSEVTAASWLAMADSESEADGEDLEAPWMRDLEACEDALNERVANRIVALGADAVMPLVRRIEASLEAADESWAPVHAATLLGLIGDARAVGPLVAAVERLEPSDALADTAVLALSKLGAAVVEPALDRALARDAHDVEILPWLDVLAHCGVRDERIFVLLEKQLASFPDFAAGCFAAYGDARALPLLHDRLNRYSLVGEVDEDRVILDLADAISALGGELADVQQRKLDAYHEGRREALGQPAARRERPGRNEPCWCGSGTKYKKCHLREDQG